MTEETTANGSGFKPPWMAFQTFWSFTQELSEYAALPPVIDRSLMSSKSGTDQINLFAALKAFELIDEEDKVQPTLSEIANSDPEIRKLALEEMVRKYYAGPLEVSAQNGTQAQLVERFRQEYGINGADTLRKATSFMLQACRTAGIEVSPYFKQTRASGTAGVSKPRKAKKTSKSGKDGAGSPPIDPPSVDQHRVSVRLKTGGTMTLTVSVDPIKLRGGDRAFFYEIVDKLLDYDQEQAGDPNDSRTPEEEGE